MIDVKEKIIKILKDEEKPISTKELMSECLPQYEVLRKDNQYNEARKLHRNFLYHLNKLLRENIIRCEKYGANGEKFFVLNISEGEDICAISPTKFKKKRFSSSAIVPAMPLEGYETEGILKKEDYLSRIDRVNSIVIDCEKKKTITTVLGLVNKFISVVTDCLCLENFNVFLSKPTLLKALNKSAGLYGKKIVLAVDYKTLKMGEIKFIEKVFDFGNLSFVFNIKKKEVIGSPVKFSKLVNLYKTNKKEIFLKNKEIFNSPYFVGTLGVYSFNESEWNSRRESDFYECCQNSAIVDVKKFYDSHGFNVSRFSEMLLNIAKSFLKINPLKRRKLREYVQSDDKQYYELSRDYIRLWNFGMLEPDLDQKKVLEIVKKSKEKLSAFCHTEDRIFNSCGMPIRFNVALTYASKESETDLSSANFKRFEIEGLEDLKKTEFKDLLKENLDISSCFDGGMRASFHRIGKVEDANDLVKEILWILEKHKLGFFSYDFEEVNNG
jgi:hypothetical protein